MKMFLVWSVTVLMLSVLFACDRGDRYGVEQGKDGRVYRIDKKTGEMAVVSGEKVMSLPEMSKDEVLLAKAISWRQKIIPPPYNLQLAFVSSWREGFMHYRLEVSPYSQVEKYRKDQNFIGIMMIDNGGFHLLTIRVLLNQMTALNNEKGERVALEKDGKIECSVETYKAFSDWKTGWTLKETE
jgi:hypothetical protein